jgi:MFS family permease
VGRKKILMPAIAVYIAASIGASFSTSIYPLLAFRILRESAGKAYPVHGWDERRFFPKQGALGLT